MVVAVAETWRGWPAGVDGAAVYYSEQQLGADVLSADLKGGRGVSRAPRPGPGHAAHLGSSAGGYMCWELAAHLRQ